MKEPEDAKLSVLLKYITVIAVAAGMFVINHSKRGNTRRWEAAGSSTVPGAGWKGTWLLSLLLHRPLHRDRLRGSSGVLLSVLGVRSIGVVWTEWKNQIPVKWLLVWQERLERANWSNLGLYLTDENKCYYDGTKSSQAFWMTNRDYSGRLVHCCTIVPVPSIIKALLYIEDLPQIL